MRFIRKKIKRYQKKMEYYSFGLPPLQNDVYTFIDNELPFSPIEDLNNSFMYSNRFVCFLDILGCTSLIYSSTKSRDAYNRVAMISQMFKELENNYKKPHWIHNFSFPVTRNGFTYDHNIPEENIIVNLSLFSDSIIISYELEDSDLFITWYRHLHQIFNDLCKLQYSFAEKGVFLRGGFTYGHIFHQGNICFGPALVDAWKLEDQHAVNPCIAVDEKLAEKILSDRGSKLYYDPEPAYRTPVNLHDVAEDLWGIYLNRGDSWGKKEGGPKYMIDWLCAMFLKSKSYVIPIRNSIVNELRKNYPPRIKAKYEWLKLYYNHSVYCLGDEAGPELEI